MRADDWVSLTACIVAVPPQVFALVYDHGDPATNNATLYWRSETDHSLQRAALSDLLNANGPVRRLQISNELPWFTDAAPAFV